MPRRRSIVLRRLAWRGRRTVAGALAGLVIIAAAATARMFVWPSSGMPARVNAIVALDAPGNRLSVALDLAREHRAPYLVISLGSKESGYGCPAPIPGVRLVCFNPNPATTQGEAEYVGSLAARLGWKSVALVAITPQVFRARLRIGRCFPGRIYAVTVPVPLSSWPYQIAYEWAALAKALVVQRGC